MKKLMVMLMACAFSIGLFADDTTCRVYGSKSNNVVTVENPVVYSFDSRNCRVWVKQTVEEKTTVVVRLYDANNQIVATETVTICGPSNSNFVDIKVPEKNTNYFARIANASCQL
ncbi:MAG: hypothetical protein II551_04545 [Paludibacteraceae bacterium]|nr:hypothetical protein [Paludibacteraceae bacterium]